jgi:hypothetical protein
MQIDQSMFAFAFTSSPRHHGAGHMPDADDPGEMAPYPAIIVAKSGSRNPMYMQTDLGRPNYA